MLVGVRMTPREAGNAELAADAARRISPKQFPNPLL